MFRRFMIFCWGLFSIFAVIGGLGGFGSKYYSDKMLSLRTEKMIADDVAWPGAIQEELQDIQADLNTERQYRKDDFDGLSPSEASSEKSFNPFLVNSRDFIPEYKGLNDEELSSELADINSRHGYARHYLQKYYFFSPVGDYAGLIAVALLLWNIFCHMVAWIIAGRKATE